MITTNQIFNMLYKKLKKEDLAELIKRSELISEHILIAQALELQKSVWLNNCLKSLGLDLTKRYEINFKNGQVKEVKEPEVQKPIKKEN